MQHNYDELHKALVGKIGDYDQNILNVGSQVQAMEKVFSKVLPKFTETVNHLGRITDFVDEKKQGDGGEVLTELENSETTLKDDEVEIPHEILHNL